MAAATFENELSEHNILAYVGAGIDIRAHLVTATNEGFTTGFIPSRGAFQFYQLALKATVTTNSSWSSHNMVVVPFTADNLERYGVSTDVRAFWVRVCDSIQKQTSNP